MAMINDELKDKLLEYQVAIATEASKVDAEHQRVKSFIQDNQDLTLWLQAAIKRAEEKESHALRLQRALNLANQRNFKVEELLNQLLTDPLAALTPPPQPNEEIEQLKSQIRIQQMQLNSISESHLRREEEMFHQIVYLQDKLKQAPEAIPSPELSGSRTI